MNERPAPEAYDSWPAYWQAQGMPWRIEPEIDAERQRFLAERRAIQPDIERGIYPFRDENGSIKLTRADVEWLLATHEDGRGPVVWEEERDKPYGDRRWGLDLRGVNLRAVNLSGLPLTRLHAGLTRRERFTAIPTEWEMAGAHLEAADLFAAHLEQAALRCAHLDRARLRAARLEQATLTRAHLENANLWEARLERAFLFLAHLEGADLSDAHLEGASIQGAFFDAATDLGRAVLGNTKDGYVWVADVRWGAVNLAVVTWGQQQGRRRKRLRAVTLGDEWQAWQAKDEKDERKGAETRLGEFEAAVRANRQLATALRGQGLNEDADYFAYRAHVLQRVVLRRQGQVGPWLFSWFLYLASGYGFRLWRILVSYLGAVGLFAVLYFVAGVVRGSPEHRYAWYQAVLVSVTNIHGRIFTGLFVLDTVQAWLAAVEAVVGLVIEGVFVAMLVQRFFAR